MPETLRLMEGAAEEFGRLKEAWIGVTRGLFADARRIGEDPRLIDIKGPCTIRDVDFDYDVSSHFADQAGNPRVMMAHILKDNEIHARSSVLLSWREEEPEVADCSVTVNEELGITLDNFIALLNKVGMITEQPDEQI